MQTLKTCHITGHRVLVTGSAGMLGSALTEVLLPESQAEHFQFDLTSSGANYKLLKKARPTHIFHLAGFNGGIVYNDKYPAEIFHRNTIMILNLMEAAVSVPASRPEKILVPVASCAYPAYEYCADNSNTDDTVYRRHKTEIMEEDCFFDGPPHETVECHGYAKRNVQLACKFYNKQYGIDAVCVCPPTLYGPRDRFGQYRAKFVGALIKRFCDAVASGDQKVSLWGTGKPRREIMYVKDAAKLLVLAMEYYKDNIYPLNLTLGTEVSIAQLAEIIADLVGYTGEIVWDTSWPDGQQQKALDQTKMLECLFGPHTKSGYSAWQQTPHKKALRQTIDWYKENHA